MVGVEKEIDKKLIETHSKKVIVALELFRVCREDISGRVA